MTLVTVLRLDGRDGHLGVRLTMTLTTAITLLRLHLEDVDLLALAGLLNRAGYNRAGNVRSAYGDGITLEMCIRDRRGAVPAVLPDDERR